MRERVEAERRSPPSRGRRSARASRARAARPRATRPRRGPGGEEPREFLRRADRELWGVIGAALIAHEVEQRGLGESERFRAPAHGLEPDDARSARWWRGCRWSLRRVPRGRPRAATAPAGAARCRRIPTASSRTPIEDHEVAERVGAIGVAQLGRHLDEEQHLADVGGRHRRRGHRRRTARARRQVARSRRDLDARRGRVGPAPSKPREKFSFVLAGRWRPRRMLACRARRSELRRRGHHGGYIGLSSVGRALPSAAGFAVNGDGHDGVDSDSVGVAATRCGRARPDRARAASIGRDLEASVELVDVADDLVAPELVRRVRIDREQADDLLVAALQLPRLRPRQEEALRTRQPSITGGFDLPSESW